MSLTIRSSQRHQQEKPSERLPREQQFQNIFETISSSRGIDHPEDIHPPKTSPSILSKTTSITNFNGSLLHCRVCYAARSTHVSHMVHNSYFNASNYIKHQILLSQLGVESPLLQKNRNVQIMRLLNLVDSRCQQELPGYIR